MLYASYDLHIRRREKKKKGKRRETLLKRFKGGEEMGLELRSSKLHRGSLQEQHRSLGGEERKNGVPGEERNETREHRNSRLKGQ